MAFFKKVKERISVVDSILCLGLDPREEQVDKFSELKVFETMCEEYVKREELKNVDVGSQYLKLRLYCLHILELTIEHVCCVKPNLAFFIAHGADGIRALTDICTFLKRMQVPIIVDGKFGDIGSTMEQYRRFVFEVIKAECCTINTFMGTDVLKAMATDRWGTYCNDLFVLAKCSNPSSTETQGALLQNNSPVYMDIVDKCESHLKENEVTGSSCGYVVGATCVDAIRNIRQRYKSCYLLIPGIGAQGGDLKAALTEALDANHGGVIVPISRAITDAKDPSEAVRYWKQEINSILR